MHSVTRTISHFCVQNYAQSDTFNSVMETINQSRHTVWGGTCLKCLNGTTPLAAETIVIWRRQPSLAMQCIQKRHYYQLAVSDTVILKYQLVSVGSI